MRGSRDCSPFFEFHSLSLEVLGCLLHDFLQAAVLLLSLQQRHGNSARHQSPRKRPDARELGREGGREGGQPAAHHADL